MIIDAHTHVYENGSHGGVEQLITQMKEAEIEKSIVIALPNVCSNIWLLSQCEQNIGTLYGMVFPNFSLETWEKDLINLFSHKCCVGMKIHPRIQNIELDDQRVERAFEIAEQYGMPVEVDIFPWGERLNSPSLKPFALHPITQKFPNIKIIIAHCGAPHILETMLLAKSNKNIYIDLSFFLKYFEGFSFIQDLEPLCKKIGYERFVYGSDFPYINLNQYIVIVQNMFEDITNKNFEMLTYLNTKEIFKI
ncbi:amidohydrolase family protein [Methanospirillum sp. J.3.6.1-F.2.7.3]|uniref:Amidohydrolase family protein n=1 Tax=Methanospirillum purgamenti TaxID=2834276 RepID=A0A8E7EK83_9EURY|nr:MULTISPECIES: amidohydrolase family protein [Methanospirillum]MDX8549483.1 amidohydrolase family protein [Methanospirillum hungatei]QVV89235.1 amidohydrolase family protein [Methanospirillum sp. J.3.6.1-F.2.7.3]